MPSDTGIRSEFAHTRVHHIQPGITSACRDALVRTSKYARNYRNPARNECHNNPLPPLRCATADRGLTDFRIQRESRIHHSHTGIMLHILGPGKRIALCRTHKRIDFPPHCPSAHAFSVSLSLWQCIINSPTINLPNQCDAKPHTDHARAHMAVTCVSAPQRAATA